MGMQLREGHVYWIQDLNGSTATTPFPTASTEGISVSAYPNVLNPPRAADRVHVRVRYQVATGVLSTDVHLYGYDSAVLSAWSYLGSINAGNSLTSNGAKWSPDGSTIALAEYFVTSGENYDRYMTRCINPQGTTPLVSTWIGFARE